MPITKTKSPQPFFCFYNFPYYITQPYKSVARHYKCEISLRRRWCDLLSFVRVPLQGREDQQCWQQRRGKSALTDVVNSVLEEDDSLAVLPLDSPVAIGIAAKEDEALTRSDWASTNTGRLDLAQSFIPMATAN